PQVPAALRRRTRPDDARPHRRRDPGRGRGAGQLEGRRTAADRRGRAGPDPDRLRNRGGRPDGAGRAARQPGRRAGPGPRGGARGVRSGDMAPTITLAPALDREVLAIGQRLLPPGFELEILSRAELAARLPEVEYLLSMGVGWLDDAQLASAGRLKLIQLMS